MGNAAWITHEGKGLKLIVVRAGKDEYCVLSRLCTHGGQTISYNRKRHLLQCNNFNHSNFGLDGQRDQGTRRDAPEVVPRHAGRRHAGGRDLTEVAV